MSQRRMANPSAENPGHQTAALICGRQTYVKLNSRFTSGSGNGIDMFLDVPTADFGTDVSQYVYLYSKFGVQAGYQADSSSEEWGLSVNSTGPTPAMTVTMKIHRTGWLPPKAEPLSPPSSATIFPREPNQRR